MLTIKPATHSAGILTQLSAFKKTAEKVNKACAEKGLPPAFDIDLDDLKVNINRDYRFEGFGIIVSFPPKVSFYVHYKPDSADHVALGKFTMPLNLVSIIQ